MLRRTFDQLYDGQHTGRFRVDQLFKTEKTHFGTLVEINLQREFKFHDGLRLDYSIEGIEVDCKYSHTGEWMLPPESFDKIILGILANDTTSLWSAGLVRVTKENRRASANRDRKTGLSAVGRSNILWIYRDAHMQPNILQKLPISTVDRIMGLNSGQQRINELFRSAQDMRISRNIVATVAQQDDYMKRVRYNGGARDKLAPEGIIILGDYSSHRRLAESLGAAVPNKGEFVSVKVEHSNNAADPVIDGRHWKIARPGSPAVTTAPRLPKV